MGTCGSKNITAMKGRAYLQQVIGRIIEGHNYMDRLFRKNRAKEPVIGTDKEPITSMHGDSATRTANARINYAHKDRPSRKVAISRRQYPGSGGHVLRCNLVSNVNNVNIGGNAGNDAFHHTNISIPKAKIGHHGDDGTRDGR